MNLTPPKLKPLHIGIITLVLALIVGGALANFWIMPILKDNSAKSATIEQLAPEASDGSRKEAEKERGKAVAAAATTMRTWRGQEARYFRVGPSRQVLDLKNALKANDELTEEQNLMLAGELTKWLNSGGNRVLVPPSVEGKGPNPNDLGAQTDVIRIAAKAIKIQGTFGSIMNLLRSTASGPRVVTVDAVALSSAQSADNTGAQATPIAYTTSDTVVADLDLTVYIYPRNGKLFTPVPVPGGDTGGGGGTGASGMPMPGGPSMPGGPQMPGGPPISGGPPIGPPRPVGPPAG